MVPGRVGPPLAVAPLSAAGVPTFPLWRPSWAPHVVAGREVQAAWLGRPPVAPPLGCGLPARASAQAGFLDRWTAGCQPGRCRASGPGLGPGPGWGPGDCEMAFLSAVLPAWLVGCSAVGMPARLVPVPADGPPGPMRWVLPEPGVLGFGWGLWVWGRTVPRGGALVVWVGVAVRVRVGRPSGGA